MDHPHRRWRCRWIGVAGGEAEAPRGLGARPPRRAAARLRADEAGGSYVDHARDGVTAQSRVPVVLDLAGRAPERLSAGRHERKTG
jgi:hypothetical protein